jgi:uncharacterized protein (TIGR02285 family)
MSVSNVVSVVLCWFWFSSACAEELAWVTLPLKGILEVKDGKLAEGSVSSTQQLLEMQLPEFTHTYQVSAPNRLQHDMAAGKSICSTATMQLPERDQVGYFIPFLPIEPMQLVTREAMQDAMPLQDGRVQLAKLIETDKFTGAITATRGYPSELGVLLAQAKQSGRIKLLESSSSGANVIAMIAYGRMDYTLEHPQVFAGVSETAYLPTRLVSLPIAEAHELMISGVYCSRTDWGRKMAIRIDQAVRAVLRQPDKVIATYKHSFEQSHYPRYEERVRAYFKQRSEQVVSF